ncbi:MAG: hypothetical protein AABZ55_03520 [Bdellovibrionota bacterium]
MKTILLILFSFCTPVASTWALDHFASSQQYDRLFPYYVELCAVTSSKFKGKGTDGKGGHAVFSLKGACKDDFFPYPRLRTCDPNPNDPEYLRGVVVSVESLFKNINWLLIGSKSFFLTGDVQEGTVLTKGVRDAVRDEAIARGIFRNTLVHEEELKDKPTNVSLEQYVGDRTIGLNFAANFGRDIYCTKLPVEKNILIDVIDYLNALNDKYFKGSEEYHWNLLADNCTHVLHNAMTGAGFWKGLKTNKSFPAWLFNLAVPANEYLNFVEEGNDTPIEDVVWQYKNDYHRTLLLNHKYLPTRHGSLIEFTPMHTPNDLYENNHEIFILDFPFFAPKTRLFKKLPTLSRYTDLATNLMWFRERYAEVLQKESRRTAQWYKKRYQAERTIASDDFESFRMQYLSYISNELEDVNRKLLTLGIH